MLNNTYAAGDLIVQGNPINPVGGVFIVDVPGQKAHGGSQDEISRLKNCRWTGNDSRPYCWDLVFRVPAEVIQKYTR
jgi:hypothetical protein